MQGIKGTSIHISSIEHYISDAFFEKLILEKEAPKGKKVAIVGSGPAGMVVAVVLAQKGYDVTIFERKDKIGGMMRYGIPDFRLPPTLLSRYGKKLRELGIHIRPNTTIGGALHLDDLFSDGYKAIFIGSGTWRARRLGVPGESLGNVHYTIDYLQSPEAYELGDAVAVIGAGNSAMDAARTALRLGAEVHIVYRRTEVELPARREEVHHARQEGIIFDMLTNPVEILGDDKGWVKSVKCIRMELGEPDESGRRSPVPIPGSEFEIETDTVIMALGTSPNPLIASTTSGLETTRRGGLVAGEDGATTRAGIFAGGDAVTGAATVILAMGAGRKAAAAIRDYLTAK